MAKQNTTSSLPGCWGQWFWWAGVLLALVAAYFFLRNFSMNYTVFIISFLAFLCVGAKGGQFLGDFIDRNHRTKKGVLRQELHVSKSLRSWLIKTYKHKGTRISESNKKKIKQGIESLDMLMRANECELEKLHEERLKLERFIESHLSQFKKSLVREYAESIGVAVLIALILRAFVIEAFQIPSGSMIPSLRVGDHIFVSKLSYGVRLPFLPLHIGKVRIPALAWNWSTPKKGDMIVFITPETEKENYIKRVVALENDTVEVRNDYVYINGQPCPIRDSGPFNYAELDEHRNFQSKISTRRFIEQIGQIEHPILRKTCATNRDCARTGTMCNYQTNLCRQSHFGPYKIPPKHVFVMGDNRDNSRDSRVWLSVPFNFIKGKAKFIWWSYRENRVQWERMFTKLR